MTEKTDSQLLRAYAAHRSEAAFGELVRRHLDLVHSAASRMVRDPHLAQDVTQGVFIALAQNAAPLSERPVLAGWLHRTAQNIAAQSIRSAVRRRYREQEAATMNDLLSENGTPPTPAWSEIAQHLDAALGELSEADRDAILLRYFEKKSAADMAQVLGISDEAAQKRVRRAVERLREFLGARGVTAGAGGLVAVISANAVQGAPAGLALSISAAALAHTAVSTAAIVGSAATQAIAMTTLQKTLITVTLAGLTGFGVYEARQASQLRGQVQTLQQQQAPLTEHLRELHQAEADATQRLSGLGTELARAKSNNIELMRLRNEVGQLRAHTNQLAKSQAQENKTTENTSAQDAAGNTAGELILRENYQFAGYAAPQDALKSLLWARHPGRTTNAPRQHVTCLESPDRSAVGGEN